MKKAPDILIAMMRPYPPKRLTEIKVYVPYLLNRYRQVKLFAMKSEEKSNHVISAGISENRNLLVRELIFNVKLIHYMIAHRRTLTHLYIFNSLFLGAPAISIARVLGIKVIWDFRSIPILKNMRSLKYLLLTTLEKINFLLVNHIVAINLVLLGKMYGACYTKKAIELPEGYITIKGSDLQQRCNSKEVKFVLPTTLDKTRNLSVIISAFKNLDNCHLYLYGDGPELKELKEEFGKWSNIHLMGHCPYEELMKRMPEYDYGIAFIPKIPQFEYQPPLKTIEYLGAGLPVIATKTFGNKIYVNEENGILVEDDRESLRAVLRNIDSYSFDRKKILASIQHYEWHNLFEKVFPKVFV